MEQSLREHKDYIVELRKDSVRQTIEYDRALVEAWGIGNSEEHSA